MKNKLLSILFITFITVQIYSENIQYPFIYIPGMFDNGDMLTRDSLLVKNLNNKDGYYDTNYFSDTYDREPLICSSNIVGAKYKRLVVANLIKEYRTNISLWLMANRLFCLMQGKAYKCQNYSRLTNYRGNDFSGTCIRDGLTISFTGILEEVWAKYGKTVYYRPEGTIYRVVLYPEHEKNEPTTSYTNESGYFDHPADIKFNFVVHSSGGLAIRRYIMMCREAGLPENINTIINLSVPQKGARMMYNLKKAFPDLIADTMDNFFTDIDNKSINIANKNGTTTTYSYNELLTKTRINMIHGDSLKARGFRKLIGNYILYFIPFDGKKRVLAGDPALHDLDPRNRLVKLLNTAPLPEDIRIINFRVKEAYAPMFQNIGNYLKLGDNDGVVDFNDTTLSHLPGAEKLNITDYIVDNANHIPFPYIEPIFELENTVAKNYGFLRVLLKEKKTKEEGIQLIYALMKTIMVEFGFDLEFFLENEDFSVIDYFAENPIPIQG